MSKCAEFKLFSGMDIPIWLWIWIAMIFAMKIINIASGAIIKKKFVAEHTIMNKITGLMMFIIPFTLYFINFKFSAIVVCVMATFAAIQERYIIRYLS